MSSCNMDQFFWRAAMESKILALVNLATGEKISKKSNTCLLCVAFSY